MGGIAQNPLFHRRFGGMANIKPNHRSQNYTISAFVNPNRIICSPRQNPLFHRVFCTSRRFYYSENRIIEMGRFV